MNNKYWRHFPWRKLISLLLIIIALFFWFSFAEGTEEGGDEEESWEDQQGFLDILNTLLTVTYILLWPLLAVAGTSVSNEFVYGSVFFMDNNLWEFWNIMKNFANYIIWFVFLLSILFYMVNYKQESYSPKKIFPKILIATVWVQASWFILALLIDLSTILTYTLWMLPLEVIESTTDQPCGDEKCPIVMPVSSINIQDEGLSGIGEEDEDWPDTTLFYTALTEGDDMQAYAPCDIQWTEIVWYQWEEDEVEENLAHFDNWDEDDLSEDYCVYRNRIVPAWDRDIEEDSRSDIVEDWAGAVDEPKSINDYAETLEGWTGPLYTLFGSLMNISDLTVAGVWGDGHSAWSYSLLVIVRIIIALALVVPLFTLAVILIVRAVVLRIIIALSPLLTISWTFDFKLGEGSEKRSISSVLWLIFLPAVAAFAISLSILFLTVLNNMWTWDGDDDSWWFESALGIEKEVEANDDDEDQDGEQKVCYSIPFTDEDGEDVDLCFATSERDLGMSPALDMFSWLLINMLGIAVMRGIVFMAMKTSKITSGIVNSIESFAKEWLKSAPIMPSPWWAQSIWSMWDITWQLKQAPDRMVADQYSRWGLQDINDRARSTVTWQVSEKKDNIRNASSVEDLDNEMRNVPKWFNAGEFIDSFNEAMNNSEMPEELRGKTYDQIAEDPALRVAFEEHGWDIDWILMQGANTESGQEEARRRTSKARKEAARAATGWSDDWSVEYRNSNKDFVVSEKSTSDGDFISVVNTKDDDNPQIITAVRKSNLEDKEGLKNFLSDVFTSLGSYDELNELRDDIQSLVTTIDDDGQFDFLSGEITINGNTIDVEIEEIEDEDGDTTWFRPSFSEDSSD